MLARRNYWTSDWDDTGAKTWLDSEGIDLVRGHGRLAGERRVEVEVAGQREPVVLLARHAVVVATGTSAAVPPIEGLREARPWTNIEATSSPDGARSAGRAGRRRRGLRDGPGATPVSAPR